MSLTANTVTTQAATSFRPEMIGRTRVTGEVSAAGVGHTLIYTCPADTLGVLKPQYIYMSSGLDSRYYISAQQSTIPSRSFFYQKNTSTMHAVRITEEEFVGFSIGQVPNHINFHATVSSSSISSGLAEYTFNSKYVQTLQSFPMVSSGTYPSVALRSQILIDAGDSIWLYDPNGNLQSIWDFLIEEYAI